MHIVLCMCVFCSVLVSFVVYVCGVVYIYMCVFGSIVYMCGWCCVYVVAFCVNGYVVVLGYKCAWLCCMCVAGCVICMCGCLVVLCVVVLCFM